MASDYLWYLGNFMICVIVTVFSDLQLPEQHLDIGEWLLWAVCWWWDMEKYSRPRQAGTGLDWLLFKFRHFSQLEPWDWCSATQHSAHHRPPRPSWSSHWVGLRKRGEGRVVWRWTCSEYQYFLSRSTDWGQWSGCGRPPHCDWAAVESTRWQNCNYSLCPFLPSVLGWLSSHQVPPAKSLLSSLLRWLYSSQPQSQPAVAGLAGAGRLVSTTHQSLVTSISTRQHLHCHSGE